MASALEKIAGIYRTISNTKKASHPKTDVLPDSHEADTEKSAIPQSISQSRVEV